jgi:hypothetical protein
MSKKAVFVLLGLFSTVLFWSNLSLAIDRVYWDETGDTIYIPNFPGRIDLHMRFDFTSQVSRMDSIVAMVCPFTWAGSVGVDSLIRKTCNEAGWFAGSAAKIFNTKVCGFVPPDKQHVSVLRTCEIIYLPPGTHYLYTVWSFMIGQERMQFCVWTPPL